MSHHKRPEVDKRLAKIEGHVHAVRNMLEQDRSYAEIVQQISAVRASLDAVVQVIVDDLVEDCVSTAKNRAVNRSVLELKNVVAIRR